MPTLNDGGVAAAAFLKLYEDVRNNVTVAGLSTEIKNRILLYQANKVRPVRLLYNVNLGDIKPSDGGMETQLLHGAEFSLVAKELIQQEYYGPNNVPTDAWR